MKLKSNPFIDSLFEGQIDEIYKENAEALKNDLISKTVRSSPHGKPQAKPEFTKPSSRPQNPRIQDKKPQSSGSSRGGFSRGSNRRDRDNSSRRASISKEILLCYLHSPVLRFR